MIALLAPLFRECSLKCFFFGHYPLVMSQREPALDQEKAFSPKSQNLKDLLEALVGKTLSDARPWVTARWTATAEWDDAAGSLQPGYAGAQQASGPDTRSRAQSQRSRFICYEVEKTAGSDQVDSK